MLPCLRGKTLFLAVQIFKGTSPVCRRLFSPPLSVRLHRRPPAPPLPPLSAINLTAPRRLHTSSRRQKKRKRETKESLLLPALLRNWQAIKASPRPALILGLVGSAPFVAPPLAMCFMQLYHPGLAAAQVLYGACVLSFLGGVRWGYALPDGSPARVNWINLATGALCPYLAFVSLLLMEDVGAAILGLGTGFGVSLAVDVLGMKQLDLAPIAPLWYKWLRGLLTAVVLASFLATLLCSSRYPALTREQATAPPGETKEGSVKKPTGTGGPTHRH